MKRALCFLTISLCIVILSTSGIQAVISCNNVDISDLAKQYSSLSEVEAKRFIEEQKFRLWPVNKVEEFFELIDSTYLFSYTLMNNVIYERLNNNIKLYADNVYLVPAYMCIGYTIEEDFRCIGMFPDDTEHVLLFEKISNSIERKVSLNVQSSEEYRDYKIRLFVIDPVDLNINGYRNVEQIPLSKKIALANEDKEGQELLIFSIIKGKNDRLYKKLVWIVKIGKAAL
jgi:hypothetical protein